MGDSDEAIELTLSELFNGNKEFIGLNNVLTMYLDHVNEKIKQMAIQQCCSFPACQAFATFRFLTAISNGTIPTIANDIRNWINNHPLYQHDSVLSHELIDELITYQIKHQNELNEKEAEFVVIRNCYKE